MRCCQNKTSFSWSYRDSSKRSLENNVKSRRGERKIHTLEIGGHMQMAKSDPEAQRKSLLSDCTWLENEYGSFNLEALKFLMHFREPESSLYFYFYTYSYFFFSFFLIHILFLLYFFSFLSLSHFIFFFLVKIFFICSPLNSKIALYLPPPPCLDACSSSGKEVIKIR
jgi:cellulose synthase/poly-beta-1,6-N-acetylglucosamine synthase-like glycosyltransferase